MAYHNSLRHSAKGSHWKKLTKYIAKIGDRYIYPSDKQNSKHGGSSGSFGKSTKKHGGSSGEANIMSDAKKKQGSKSSASTPSRDYAPLPFAKSKQNPTGEKKAAAVRTKRNSMIISTASAKRKKTNLSGKSHSYMEGLYREYMGRERVLKRSGTGKPKNKTARKNQRREKLRSLIFKGKRLVKKALKRMGVDTSNRAKQQRKKARKARNATTVTVTSNLMPARTKKTVKKR